MYVFTLLYWQSNLRFYYVTNPAFKFLEEEDAQVEISGATAGTETLKCAELSDNVLLMKKTGTQAVFLTWQKKFFLLLFCVSFQRDIVM